MSKTPPPLKLFIDTADLSAWERWLPTGLFFGATTNPLLLERANVPCTLETLTSMAHTAFDLGANEIHMQVWGTDASTMEAVGTRLAAIDSRVVVKVPITAEGSICAARLIAGGARVTLTGVYAAYQFLTAITLGADYAAPYLGRMNEAGRDGFDEIITMHNMRRSLDCQQQLLVASLRQIDDLAKLAQHGIDAFTIAPALADALFSDPLTRQAAEDFEAAARAMGAVDPDADQA